MKIRVPFLSRLLEIKEQQLKIEAEKLEKLEKIILKINKIYSKFNDFSTKK